MKKVVSTICLISILLLAPKHGHAEFDITKMLENGMTLTDIVCLAESDPSTMELLSQLNETEIAVMELLLERELQRRNFNVNGVVVPMGVYTVGADIPAGSYSIKLAKPDSVPFSIVTIRSKSGTVGGHYYLSDAEAIIGKVTLMDGETVEISSDSVLFSPYKGLGF